MEIKRRTFLQAVGGGIGAALTARIVSPISAFAEETIGGSQKDEGKVLIEWLGHGSFRFESLTGMTILLDPWLSTNPRCPAKYKTLESFSKVDMVLFTHGHADHFMLPDTKGIVERYDPKIVAPCELGFFIKDKIPKANTLGFQIANKGAMIELDGVKITMVGADHSSGLHLTGFENLGEYIGEPAGYVIEFENGLRIYHSGDTGLMADMEIVIGNFYEPDVAILPIGNVFTMGPREAAYACKLIRPKIAIPEHYGTFPTLVQGTDEFTELVRHYAPRTRVVVLEPGVSKMV